MEHILRWRGLIGILTVVFAIAVLPANAQDQPTEEDDKIIPSVELVQMPGRVVEALNLRSAPAVREDTLIQRLEPNDPIWVATQVQGEDGDLWYQVGADTYVHAAEVRLPNPPPQTFTGRWLDVELTTPALVTAYENDQPVGSALAIKGRGVDETPQGTFTILRRVYDETMDSETLGVPHDDPQGYYLENVLYTQYFTDEGDSLHYNYWSSNFGEEGSHGCLGLSLDDSAWLWDWADEGTVVNIHS